MIFIWATEKNKKLVSFLKHRLYLQHTDYGKTRLLYESQDRVI